MLWNLKKMKVMVFLKRLCLSHWRRTLVITVRMKVPHSHSWLLCCTHYTNAVAVCGRQFRLVATERLDTTTTKRVESTHEA